jgi:hypothetical protein
MPSLTTLAYRSTTVAVAAIDSAAADSAWSIS